MTLFAIPYTIVLTVQMRGTQNFVDVSLFNSFIFEFYIISILQSFFTFFTNIKYSMMLSRIKHDTNTVKSRAVACLGSSTFSDFQKAYVGEI